MSILYIIYIYRNIDIYINFKYENEDIQQELKDKKVIIKDEKMKLESINSRFNSLNITTFTRTFNLDNTDVKKKLYSFKIEL